MKLEASLICVKGILKRGRMTAGEVGDLQELLRACVNGGLMCLKLGQMDNFLEADDH